MSGQLPARSATGGHGELQVPPRGTALRMQAMWRQGHLPMWKPQGPMQDLQWVRILPMWETEGAMPAPR